MPETPRELAQRLGGRPNAASWPIHLNQVVEWAVERAREQGRIDKADLLARFAWTENHYPLLRDAIAQCFRDLTIGSRGSGGWRLKARRAPATLQRNAMRLEAIEIALDDQLDGTQSIVANRLAELLSHDQLRSLVGDTALNSLRSLVRAVRGREPNLSKRSLAAALILRDGHELLADQDVREALCRAAKIESVARWHSGKSTALALVRALGLPQEYAGTPAARAADDVEHLASRVSLPPLEDFQRKVKTDASELLRQGRRCILTMPTGAGKTRTAVELLCDFARDLDATSAILWIAHTSELLEQADESVRQVWAGSEGLPDLRLDRRFGQHGRGDNADAECLAAPTLGLQLVIATPTRLINDLERWRREHPQALDAGRRCVRLRHR